MRVRLQLLIIFAIIVSVVVTTDVEKLQTHSLEVDGSAVPMTDMGPVIINKDGTTRRISNWKLLSKKEQERTWERIAKRNKERISILEEQHKRDDNHGKHNEQHEEADVALSLPSGTESVDELAAALAEIEALHLEDNTELRIPSMF